MRCFHLGLDTLQISDTKEGRYLNIFPQLDSLISVRFES